MPKTHAHDVSKRIMTCAPTLRLIGYIGRARRGLERWRAGRFAGDAAEALDEVVELSRHSDHHAHPTRPYQVLRHFDDVPQLPTGYPGMMLLSTVPPLFFAVMHRRVAESPATAA